MRRGIPLHLLSLSLGACLMLCVDSASAQAGSGFAPPPNALTTSLSARWSAADESWLHTNRRIAIAGKVLTVVGRVTAIASVIAGAQLLEDPEYWAALGVAGTGELMWSIADLRAINRLDAAGLRVRRGAAITSVIGSLTLAPLTWIAGPIASARIRAAHADLLPTSSMNPPPALSVRGASLTIRF